MEKLKKKPKFSLPPTQLTIDDRAMQEMIEKGGSAVSKKIEVIEVDKLKSFTFKIYESELAKIRVIQDKLPKRDRISIHDFVLSAVLEKIEKDNSK